MRYSCPRNQTGDSKRAVAKTRAAPKKIGWLAAAACATTLIASGFFAASSSGAATATIPLGVADNFTILGGSTVTNTGTTIITGNLGLSPGTSVTGFPPGSIINGTIHINDALANQAHTDAFTAYTQLAGETPTTNLTGTNLGGLTLTPGVYHFDTLAQLTGTLTLDTGGNPNAAFHFQIGTTLTTASNSAITLLNGSSVNIFWQVGTSATIGVSSVFQGNIIADQSITFQNGATLDGKALAINAAVTLDTNMINGPPPVVPEPSALVLTALALTALGFTPHRRTRKS